MLKKWLLLTLPLISLPVQSQQLAKSGLVEDLTFLNEAVRNHPANYQLAEKIHLDSLISEVKRNYPDSISWRLYESKVREAVWEIGCVHTSVSNSPIRTKEKVQNGFFPLDVFTDGLNLFLCEDSKDTNLLLQRGDQIVSVNGLPVPALMHDLSLYKSPDGRGISYAQQIVNRNFAALYFIYFGASDSFAIEFIHEGRPMSETIAGKDKSVLKAKEVKIIAPANLKVLFTDKEAFFGMLPNNIAYLRINSFKKKCKPFYRKIFRYLEENPAQNLVIDLRDNLGGSRTNVEVLLSYLINEKTGYRIIRPKDNLGNYLHGKERLKFWASFLYFDVQELFYRKKLDDGVAFRYYVKPRKSIYGDQIYLLINGFSASSSTVTASYLKHHRQAITIGQQTSGGEYMNNGGSYPSLILPQSKIEIRTATYRFEYDFGAGQKGGIVPDYEVVYDVETYLKVDLEMQKVLELVDNKIK